MHDEAPGPIIVVVGGGIVGCMVARELQARAPRAAIVVLDRDAVGCGASRRSAGLHFPRGATERVRRMAAFSQGYYERLRAARPSLPIRSLDMSIVASRDGAHDVHEVYLDSAGLTAADEVPGAIVRVPPGSRVWRGSGCQYADVQRVAQAIARGLPAHVEVREGVCVKAIEPSDADVRLTLGTGTSLTVDRVVLAPGPWVAAPAWHELVSGLAARVKKVVALHVQQPPGDDDGAVIFHDEDAFLLPLHERGQWLFSYTCREWDVDPDSIAAGGGLSARDLEAARETLHRYAPRLADRCRAGRVFCDAYSPTGEPLVRALDDAGRVVFAGAANGSGYRLAPAIAVEAASLLLNPTVSRSYA